MLFGPQRNQRLRDPPAQSRQTVKAGVTGGADGDQQIALMDAGLTMMHMEALPCPAGLTGAPVALQNVVAEAGEALAGTGGGTVAGPAEAAHGREVTAAWTEQGPLNRRTRGSRRSGQEKMVAQNCLC